MEESRVRHGRPLSVSVSGFPFLAYAEPAGEYQGVSVNDGQGKARYLPLSPDLFGVGGYFGRYVPSCLCPACKGEQGEQQKGKQDVGDGSGFHS